MLFLKMKNCIYEKTKNLRKNIIKYRKKFDKNILFSIGENCLADNILARNGLKSFSSPYASARSNIEYILSFENEKFNDFLNDNFLSYDKPLQNNIPINKKYVEVKNNYHNSCSRGFEFTHHNVKDNNSDRNKISKRCNRLLKLRNRNIIMLYHHRYCKNTDLNLLISNLSQLADIYKNRKNNVNIFLFTQKIVSEINDRHIVSYIQNDINVYEFYTTKIWGGDDEEILWARCDDDLLNSMIIDIKSKLI